MTSTACALLFDDVLGNVASRLGFAEVNTLVLSHQADVAPQFAVTESGYSHQAKGAQKQATKEPSHTAMSFVVSNDSGKEGARYPEKGKRNHRQPKHHQSVVATKR